MSKYLVTAQLLSLTIIVKLYDCSVSDWIKAFDAIEPVLSMENSGLLTVKVWFWKLSLSVMSTRATNVFGCTGELTDTSVFCGTLNTGQLSSRSSTVILTLAFVVITSRGFRF